MTAVVHPPPNEPNGTAGSRTSSHATVRSERPVVLEAHGPCSCPCLPDINHPVAGQDECVDGAARRRHLPDSGPNTDSEDGEHAAVSR